MEVSIQELENQLKTCLHINAMKIILSEIDAVHDISPSLQFQGRKRYLNERERKLLDSFRSHLLSNRIGAWMGGMYVH